MDQTHSLEKWQHSHQFGQHSRHAETSTAVVMWITALMMGVEIVAGMIYGSVALLADGWHMATHVAAFAISLFAYRYARVHAANERFTFGTGKVSVLGGFASAVGLAVVALMMGLESISRLLQPQPIHFDEAILIAEIGLLVNLVCGLILHKGGHHHDEHSHHRHKHKHHHHVYQHKHDHDYARHHHHDHVHPHKHEHGHVHHHDHNLHAAYLHVLADALTSVLAIIALLAAKYYGLLWLDPAMGIIGALMITRWSQGLVSDTSQILLDGAVDSKTQNAIKNTLEALPETWVSDLHVWAVGAGHYAACVSIVTHQPQTPDDYKQLLRPVSALSHVIIEVHHCREQNCQTIMVN